MNFEDIWISFKTNKRMLYALFIYYLKTYVDDTDNKIAEKMEEMTLVSDVKMIAIAFPNWALGSSDPSGLIVRSKYPTCKLIISILVI